MSFDLHQMGEGKCSLRRERPRISFVAAEVARLTSKSVAKSAKEDRVSSRRLLQDEEVFSRHPWR